ncbi:GNAT family N-acetyltransferase [Kovacikia minuta CCNUW1]|uniref:GNAT family N-acetyltransferase n=1 Tax=Kovacikia minuta TaxID=2931930 RepID=UPI001CCD5A91|nr:GNAT family N-acetyltransferase [Kovacikia minuta]UBF28117.1 GNAT family N-acetyltransferase [Kovacikia minuta CCNUW1]
MDQSPKITVRPVQEEDLVQVVNLDRLSFAPLSTNAEIKTDWYSNGLNLPGRRLFLATEPATNSGIGSYAQLDLGIWFEGQEFPSIGIAAVAVAPHRRGQGVARLMLEHALEMGRSHQIPLMMLYPFQHGFYRKLGWAWVGRTHQYRVSARHLPTFSQRSHIIPYDPNQHQQSLQKVYHQAASQQNGWLQRRDWQWQNYLKPAKGREIYCYVESGTPLGYVIVQFVDLNPPQDLLAVVVREWVAFTIDAYRGIVGFLASLRDQISTIIWNTYAEDPFPHLLREQQQDPALANTPFSFGLTHRFGEIGGGFMWRLVDLEAAFRLRRIPTGSPFSLSFQVTDPILGDRSLTVDYGDGQMHFSNQSAPIVIRLSIEHLTALFCGMRRATELAWTGEIEVEGDRTLLANLDAAWQATPPFCWDFF